MIYRWRWRRGIVRWYDCDRKSMYRFRIRIIVFCFVALSCVRNSCKTPLAISFCTCSVWEVKKKKVVRRELWTPWKWKGMHFTGIQFCTRVKCTWKETLISAESNEKGHYASTSTTRNWIWQQGMLTWFLLRHTLRLLWIILASDE